MPRRSPLPGLRALALLLAAALCGPSPEGQDIFQRLSIKYILDANGKLPQGVYSDPLEIETVIAQTNETLQRWGRGYGYWITEIETVSGFPQFHDLSKSEMDLLELAAEQNPLAFHWRTDATNIYVVNSTPTNFASIPSSDPGREIVVMRASTSIELNWAHELGHHNNLSHPFNADDHVADTMPEPSPNQCTTSFGCELGGDQECCCSSKIANLQAAADAGGWTQQQTDDLLYNVMGYFGATDCDPLLGHDFDNVRLTPGQLDRWTDATRDYHAGEVTGLTWFVDAGAPPFGTGHSYAPFPLLSTGLGFADASGGDIVLLRAGSYDETPTIDQPVVLRASGGSAVIGL